MAPAPSRSALSQATAVLAPGTIMPVVGEDGDPFSIVRDAECGRTADNKGRKKVHGTNNTLDSWLQGDEEPVSSPLSGLRKRTAVTCHAAGADLYNQPLFGRSDLLLRTGQLVGHGLGTRWLGPLWTTETPRHHHVGVGCRVLIGGSSLAVDLPGSENANRRRQGPRSWTGTPNESHGSIS